MLLVEAVAGGSGKGPSEKGDQTHQGRDDPGKFHRGTSRDQEGREDRVDHVGCGSADDAREEDHEEGQCKDPVAVHSMPL